MAGAQAAGANPWDMDWTKFAKIFEELAAKMGKAHGSGPGHRHGTWASGRGPGHWAFGPGAWRGPNDFLGTFFGGPPWSRGRKAKRGDVRAAILALLAEEPRNGYQIIQEIHERSGGAWKPSPGAVYPALQQLADEGLVRAEEREGSRTFHLTDAGRRYVEERGEEFAAPWEAMAAEPDVEVADLFKVAAQCSGALMQIVHTGNVAQAEQAKDILTDTRRKLYRVLAEDGADDEDAG